GGKSIRHAFARGVSGLTYLNLSSLDLTHGATLQFRTRRLSIPDQEVQLIALPNDLDPAHQTVLVISPHPDDAEIAAYGFYTDRHAYVVTVMAGETGDPGLFSMFSGSDAFAQKGHVRAWNSVAVPMLGNIPADHTANLGYFDGTLKSMQLNPQRVVVST